MKKFFLLVVIATIAIDVNAQSSINKCFNDYYTTFRDHGADPVPDGLHEVVVSIRKEGECTCVMGIITVKEGKPINDLMLVKEDGTYEKFLYTPHSAYSDELKNFKNVISNGMSPTYYSSNDEAINLFFIKYLKEKKMPYKLAPPIKK